MDGLLVGVTDLEVSLLAGGTEDLEVGVEDLTGVDDLGWAITDFGGNIEREVGVEDLGNFDAVGSAGRPVGVAGLDEVTLEPPDEDGLRTPEIEELKLADGADCLDVVIFLEEGSAGLANRDFNKVGWPFGT